MPIARSREKRHEPTAFPASDIAVFMFRKLGRHLRESKAADSTCDGASHFDAGACEIARDGTSADESSRGIVARRNGRYWRRRTGCSADRAVCITGRRLLRLDVIETRRVAIASFDRSRLAARSFSRPSSFGLRESEYWVFAMQIGKSPKPNDVYLCSLPETPSRKSTPSAPKIFVATASSFSSSGRSGG